MIYHAAHIFADLPSVLVMRADNGLESQAAWETNGDTLHRITAAEQRLARLFAEGKATGLRGYSITAEREVTYAPATDGPTPNWREGLGCPVTSLNNRCRAAIDLLQRHCGLRPSSRLYISEQTTSTYTWLHQHYPLTVGSEYLDPNARPGEEMGGIRHEDLTRLSFADGTVDVVASFDCLEHIPDFRGALRELARVLAPGGYGLFTFPFTGGPSTLIRASVQPDGSIVHHETPEYHGDPIRRDQGILCYQHFGHDVLDDMRSAGFAEAWITWIWSSAFGYLGGLQPYFLARKARRA